MTLPQASLRTVHPVSLPQAMLTMMACNTGLCCKGCGADVPLASCCPRVWQKWKQFGVLRPNLWWKEPCCRVADDQAPSNHQKAWQTTWGLPCKSLMGVISFLMRHNNKLPQLRSAGSRQCTVQKTEATWLQKFSQAQTHQQQKML